MKRLTLYEALITGHPLRRYPVELKGEIIYVTRRQCIKELYSQLDLAKRSILYYQAEATKREKDMGGSIAGLQRERAADVAERQRITDRLTEINNKLATENATNRSLQGNNSTLRAELARANRKRDELEVQISNLSGNNGHFDFLKNVSAQVQRYAAKYLKSIIPSPAADVHMHSSYHDIPPAFQHFKKRVANTGFFGRMHYSMVSPHEARNKDVEIIEASDGFKLKIYYRDGNSFAAVVIGDSTAQTRGQAEFLAGYVRENVLKKS